MSIFTSQLKRSLALILSLTFATPASLFANAPETHSYDPFIIQEISTDKSYNAPTGFAMCQNTVFSVATESCTTWSISHKDANSTFAYFSRVDEFANPIAENCVTHEVIRSQMALTLLNAFAISPTNLRGIFFDATYPRSSCRIAYKFQNRDRRDEYYSVQAAYSGALPPGFGGCQGVEDAITPVLQDCKADDDKKKLGIILGSVFGGICTFCICYAILSTCFNKNSVST